MTDTHEMFTLISLLSQSSDVHDYFSGGSNLLQTPGESLWHNIIVFVLRRTSDE
jgi:hypothetical protein